jgi:hypothetical protein
MDDNTLRALQSNYMRMTGGLQLPDQQAEAKPKRSGIVSWLPAIGGTVGSIGGGILGGVGGFFGGAGIGAVPGAAVGAGAGGAAGGALGEWLAQKLSGESKDGYDMGNIFQEGAINGVLGAVPLGKVGQIGKGVIKGAGERALVRGGEEVAGQVAKKGAEEAAGKVASGGIKNWIGGKLLGQADDTALRAVQLSGKKEALKGFEKRFGEDLGTYIRNNNLIGATGKDVESGLIKNLNKEYGDIVSKIKTPITSSDVLAQNMSKGSSLSKLLKSGSTENKQLADDVFKELDAIFKDAGEKGLSASRVAELKSEYQTLAKNAYKLGSNSKASVNEKVAEYLKKTLQGVSGSDDLARVGKELDKAYKASDLLASAAQNGRGTLSFGLTDAMIAAPGAVVGGVPGMVAAVAGKKAFNSPRVQSFISNKLASAGERLVAGGGEKVAEGAGKAIFDTTAKGMLKQQVPGRAIQGLGIMSANAQPSGDGGAAMNPNSPFNPSSPNYNPNLVDPTAVGDPNDLGSIMGVEESPYSLQAMQADVMRDPKNADEYMKIYEIMNPQGSELTLSDSAISRTTDAQKALGGLDELDSILADGYAGGKVSGNLRKLNPFDSKFQTQQASIDRIRQIVGKALEGGVLRKEDEDKYKKILPTMQDQPDVYRAKVAQLRSMIQADMQSYLQLQQGYGKGAGQAGGADIQQLLGVQ